MQIYGKLGAAWDRNASLYWSHQSKLMDMSKYISLKVKNVFGIVAELNMGTFFTRVHHSEIHALHVL